MDDTVFITTIKSFYVKNKRQFPWRDTKDSYAILVSELMLQQTQTHRVLPKYTGWLKLFPTVKSLAQATLFEVLQAWSGLGYNRRAKFLWETAKTVMESYQGRLPRTYAELNSLPGIGEYTANALLAFAYNKPAIVLETNIRTALIHHFFKDDEKVSDKQLKMKLEELLSSINDPKDWYYALMDYGNWLKAEGFDYFHKQKNYTKQKPFKGSDRFVRGWILKELTNKGNSLSLKSIRLVGYTKKQIEKIVALMIKDELLIMKKKTLYIRP